MSENAGWPAPSQGGDASLAACLFCIDPAGLGGLLIRAWPGTARDDLLQMLRGWLPPTMPWCRVPVSVSDDRLMGALDLAATLSTGRRVFATGLLAEAGGGVLVLSSADRLEEPTAAKIAAAMDGDGARFGVVALDEGLDDEGVPKALAERLGLHVTLDGLRGFDQDGVRADADALAHARDRLSQVIVPDDILTALCQVALVYGLLSVRASLQAVRAARCAAALAGRLTVTVEDAALAARLTLAARALTLPATPAQDDAPVPATEDAKSDDPPPEHDDTPDPHSEPQSGVSAQQDQTRSPDDPAKDDKPAPADLEDLLIAAVRAALPAALLASLKTGATAPRKVGAAGTSGQARLAPGRGRKIGVRIGDPRAGERLELIETLRAAAPWQRVRRRMTEAMSPNEEPDHRIRVMRDDFRVARRKKKTTAVTIFVVDASGSSAMRRLAEAKGAVEMLLAECYVRRDEVALIAFRRQAAELLLPPTRSLTRARRLLAAMVGGGGTPLAAAIEAAATLVDTERRRGSTPQLVFLTDGQANVARDGTGGRVRADADALSAAQRLKSISVPTLMVDTSARPQPKTQALANALGATYVPLPQADAKTLMQAARQIAPAAQR